MACFSGSGLILNTMENYREHEIKILGVDVLDIQQKLETLGAKKISDGIRVITTFDTPERKFTHEKKIIRITEEDKIKLSVNFPSSQVQKNSIKVFTSRKKETQDFLGQLWIVPITEVHTKRISYEWGEVDFDIDIFPEIPAFLEIDIEHLPVSLDELLSKLGCDNKRQSFAGTEEIFAEYGKDYYTLFQIKN